ncbi:hypothetical protein LOAG_13666 [Loa loa]|uniref:Uncharacterized protein n=1 Tax=Loa loa TaxID=7209 RepID=A0A1S0TJ49_LOALO|nr:hypothetical protein LOAG_13666 [Loa loa]EFO14850.1 hypothetical protein LOAG_13666 [Loa loa]
MSIFVGEEVVDGIDEMHHELMEWHPKSGLLALTTYHANVGSEINFFTHQVSK